MSDPASKESTKPARACEACYETVFPLLDPPIDGSDPFSTSVSASSTNTITALSNFPSWLSMPSLPISSMPEALMAIDREPRVLSSIEDPEVDFMDEYGGELKEGVHRVRLKSPSRQRSYHEILEDFNVEGLDHGRFGAVGSPLRGQQVVLEEDEEEDEEGGEGDDDGDDDDSGRDSALSSKRQTVVDLSSSPTPKRREDTARRSKRFSMPAVALQTTSVTAQTHNRESGDALNSSCGGRGKRFSLVLGGGRAHGSQTELAARKGDDGESGGSPGKSELGRGVAALRLSELLGRKKG